MFDLFDEVIEFEMMGGFDDAEKEALIRRAKKLGINVNDFDSFEELKAVIEDLEKNIR